MPHSATLRHTPLHTTHADVGNRMKTIVMDAEHHSYLMLNLAKGIFEDQSDLEKLITKIMSKAKELLDVERCGVYLVNKELEEVEDGDIVFGTAVELRNDEEGVIKPKSEDIAKSKLTPLVKKVAISGQHLNLDMNDESNSQIESLNDETMEVHSVLCMPIYNGESKIIGAAVLINKNNLTLFNAIDVITFEAFAIFCGLGIHNAQMYDNACKLMAKQQVALEVLSFHAMATTEETTFLMKAQIQSAQQFKLYDFKFDDFKLTDNQTLHAAIRMFMEWDVINKFNVPYNALCSFLLSVRKNYRPVIYHNWRHALNVAQTMFAMLTTGNMLQYVTDLEAFALIVACLCHDLDHRGTNNTFQTKTASALAQLYGTSTMEHHHFDQCIMILNSEGNTIFQSLSAEDYRTVIKLIEAAIISTDLALYFAKKGKFIEVVENGEKDFKTPEQQELLRAMMMTACDVSAITKPWEIQKAVAELVSSEFFEQGDLEKYLNEEPIAMMDREKRDELPKMQAFSELNIALLPLYDGVKNNRNEWKKLDDIYQQKLKDESENKEQGMI
ncbi:cGMP-specific 3',5'-cyclic phosphodiesterase [Nymphon striatum]|nr:cGMP-specific 3',5'-cyclic phosphodiesterase [Nymphon striatum]